MKNTRPVSVSTGIDSWKGCFHGWTTLGGETSALVEDMTGSIKLISPWMLKFEDRKRIRGVAVVGDERLVFRG